MERDNSINFSPTFRHIREGKRAFLVDVLNYIQLNNYYDKVAYFGVAYSVTLH